MDAHWYKQLKAYLGLGEGGTVTPESSPGGNNGLTNGHGGDATSSHPGPIDNGPLFDEGGEGKIRDHMIDDLDYQLVPEECWQALVEAFGTTEGQQPVARKVH